MGQANVGEEVLQMVAAPSVFISYSSQDEQVARNVRNLFEARGHQADLVKLQQSMSEDFIMDLLRKELKARDWVVIVESPNAQHSHWVSFERSVAAIYKKPIYHIDAACVGKAAQDSLEQCLRQEVARISRRLRVYISYSHRDESVAHTIREFLINEGYLVQDAQNDVSVGGDFVQGLQRAIDETMEKGVMLVLVSANSVQSRWVEMEMNYGLRKQYSGQGRVVPCLIPPRANPPIQLATIQWLDMTRDMEQGLRELRMVLESR